MSALLLWKYGAVLRTPRRPFISSLFQSSAAGGPTPANPVSNARPSETTNAPSRKSTSTPSGRPGAAYAALADSENAFLWLERALEDRSTLINFMALDPMLDALRGDDRFGSLVQRTGIYQRVLPDTAAIAKSP